jgi:hypothetical protein
MYMSVIHDIMSSLSTYVSFTISPQIPFSRSSGCVLPANVTNIPIAPASKIALKTE